MAELAVTANSSAALLGNNSLGRKFQNPNQADCPVFVKRFYYKNESGATLADGSIIDLGPILGPGIIINGLFSCSALGASRTIDMGLQEYTNQLTGETVAASIDTLIDGVDASSARTDLLSDIQGTNGDMIPDGLEIYGPVRLLAKVIGDVFPVDGIISGYIEISKPL